MRHDRNTETNTHKLTDWEIGALYWNCEKSYGPDDGRAKFRHHSKRILPKKDSSC